tara:strand:- start:66 stop:671 length:606 start_codon:yes stop_codon:yes gene_type:complete
MKIYFKSIHLDCVEINCDYNIQLGELFKIFSEKSSQSLRGICINSIGNVKPMNKNVCWNKTLKELDIIVNSNAFYLMFAPYEFYWKYQLYERNIFQYPPKHLNEECPINLQEIGECNRDYKENQTGSSNTPPNIVLVDNKGYVIAFNTLNLLMAIKNTNSVPYFEYKLPFYSNKGAELLMNIVDNSMKDYCYREPYLTIKL